MAFHAGAALCHLHLLTVSPDLPQALWRARLSLAAAAACAGFAGRTERAAALRDALHLTRPGDHPGPAGEIAQAWMQAVARPVPRAKPEAAWAGPALSGLEAADRGGADPAEEQHIPPDPDAGPAPPSPASPVDRAAAVLEAALAAAPCAGTRTETAALIQADGALALALGWDLLLPLLALGLSRRDLRQRGPALRLACGRALVTASTQAVRLAAELTPRAARLRALAPRLRARGAERAVALFLARDALAPAALAGIMSDRAARRFCDRLVALGGLRELTGRDSFRLYGL